jgi:hypothetical protein
MSLEHEAIKALNLIISKLEQNGILDFQITYGKICNPISYDGVTLVNRPTGEVRIEITYMERMEL